MYMKYKYRVIDMQGYGVGTITVNLYVGLLNRGSAESRQSSYWQGLFYPALPIFSYCAGLKCKIRGQDPQKP